MATVWIGDFRCRQIQYYQNNVIDDNLYLIEDTAEYTWFNDELVNQLPQLSMESANVIIMLGFNDCLYSCAWKDFDIDKIAQNYIGTIKKLVKKYSSIKFYICSVNPIEGNYSFAEQSNEIILEDDLLKKIERFNKKLKNEFGTSFIDIFSYLKSTSFYTHDGIHFDAKTIENILAKIYMKLGTSFSGGSAFIPRLTAPTVSAEVDNYWLGTSYGGLNPFELNPDYGKIEGDTLPNCTAWAWGRFYELLGSKPTLSTGNAERWYLNNNDGYKRGQEPKLGAVICWQAGATTEGADGAGHVAIVEQINPDGSIVTSESGWEQPAYWWKTTRKNTDGNWQGGSGYTFQGFIYCPITSSTTISKDNLCVKNSYGITREQMKPNAQYIWQYLGSRGWTLNAVAGMLGNIEQESKMSPGVWETPSINNDCEIIDQVTGVHTLTEKGKKFTDGYGLTQWTPATKFFSWCNSGGKTGNANGTGKVLPYWDIDTQLKRIEAELEVSGKSWVEGLSQWIAKPSKGYDLTFKDFIASTKDAYWLAGAFAFCYERPGRSTGSAAEQAALKEERGRMGKYWYDYLNSLPQIVINAVSTAGLHVKGLKVDEQLSTKAKLSFLVQNATKASFTLNEADSNKKDKKKPKTIDLSDGLTIFNIKSLTPNTDYLLELYVEGGGKTITEKLSFSTTQDYPESFEKIKLSARDDNLPCDNFKLDVTPNKPDFGYWKSDGYGYTIQLLVNGRLKCEKSIDSLPTNLKISDYFNYNCELGDIIQIGIRTWGFGRAHV